MPKLPSEPRLRIRPNLPRLGPKHGKDLRAITQALEALSQQDIQAFSTQGLFVLSFGKGKQLTLHKEDALIDSIANEEKSTTKAEAFAVAHDASLGVALDLRLNDALRAEGLARDLVHMTQKARKENDLHVQEKIVIHIAAPQQLHADIYAHERYICEETQALRLTLHPPSHSLESSTSFIFNTHTIFLSFDRTKPS